MNYVTISHSFFFFQISDFLIFRVLQFSSLDLHILLDIYNLSISFWGFANVNGNVLLISDSLFITGICSTLRQLMDAWNLIIIYSEMFIHGPVRVNTWFNLLLVFGK